MVMRRIVDAIKRARVPSVIRSVRTEGLTYLDEAALLDLHEVISACEKESKQGILIEAGCALGGAALVMANAKSRSRPFYVYDVFAMIPPPSDKDGEDVHKRYDEIVSGQSKGISDGVYYGYQEGLLGKVTQTFVKFGIPPKGHEIRLIKGLFEDTLEVQQPVLLAHIDCDWYESVITCMKRIEPNLVPGGVLVIDDYDAWSGCRQAVEDYFADKWDRYRRVRKARMHIVRSED